MGYYNIARVDEGLNMVDNVQICRGLTECSKSGLRQGTVQQFEDSF
ncbi:MAG: hypothetical protein JSW47_04565 [Phycisphaerales bacterium]|nr:MAG: hypothetical protein JSW47_04565 [Phycisphaerales bacterium]